MQKLLTGLAIVSALSVSAAQACEFHNTTASKPTEEVVAMSTATTATPVVVAPAQPCPAGQANCAPDK